MEFKLVPAKNQKFDIGRTINLAKCDCKKCDFMHCPKNNYALKMVRKKDTVQEFFNANKEEIVKARSLKVYFNFDTVVEFMDDIVIGFPKGTYWNMDYYDSIKLVARNRSKYGADFLPRVEISFSENFPITYYVGCTVKQEKLAEKIQMLLRQLNDLLIAELAKEI